MTSATVIEKKAGFERGVGKPHIFWAPAYKSWMAQMSIFPGRQWLHAVVPAHCKGDQLKEIIARVSPDRFYKFTFKISLEPRAVYGFKS